MERSVQHNYTVDLSHNLNINISSIAEDSILNKAENRSENVAIIGQVTNALQGDEVEIYCSCEACETGWKLA